MKIIRAAEKVLRSNGANGVLISAVASQAGMSVGGLYRRFATKEDLLASVNDLAISRAHARFEAVVRQAPPTSAEAAVTAAVAGLCLAWGAEAALYRSLFNAGIQKSDRCRFTLQDSSKNLQIFEATILPYIRILDPHAAGMVVTMIWQVITGSVLNKITTDSENLLSISWHSFRDELTKVAIAYLRAQTFPGRAEVTAV